MIKLFETLKVHTHLHILYYKLHRHFNNLISSSGCTYYYHIYLYLIRYKL